TSADATNTGRVGSAGVFRPRGVSGLADATSIGSDRFLAGAKNPLRTLIRQYSQTVSDQPVLRTGLTGRLRVDHRSA
ncbi:MAG: hypothetical protein O9325_18505, partial [Roseomonas sp.]|nr:hypothetical protein [Roseomonas sp.]